MFGYLLLILIIVLFAMFLEWHAKYVFVAIVYPRKYGHGKSWKKANRHYKITWTFWQRLLWVPIFCECYPGRYRFMAILSYLNVIVTVSTIIVTLVAFACNLVSLFVVSYAICAIFDILRFCYNNAIARGYF